MAFLHDDFEGARAQAASQDKLLFVDAWAEWCHTCKSMKSFVLSDPALGQLSDRVVFVALDTDKPENAAFLEQYEVRVWPSLFTIDPASKALMGYWPGSASLDELESFLHDSLDALEASRQSQLAPDSPRALMIRAKTAQMQGKPAKAAPLYSQALARAPADWPRRSEALHGQLWALAQAGQVAECRSLGEQHFGEVQGTSLPAFYASIWLDCLEHDPDPVRRSRLRLRIIERLRTLLDDPPNDMAADDQEDTWRIVASALEAEGKHEQALEAQKRRLGIMEQAAARAPSPSAAATFDAGRANAYLALGRPDDAVRLLRDRISQLPDSYEPPARLASVLEALGKREAALAALDQALD